MCERETWLRSISMSIEWYPNSIQVRQTTKQESNDGTERYFMLCCGRKDSSSLGAARRFWPRWISPSTKPYRPTWESVHRFRHSCGEPEAISMSVQRQLWPAGRGKMAKKMRNRDVEKQEDGPWNSTDLLLIATWVLGNSRRVPDERLSRSTRHAPSRTTGSLSMCPVSQGSRMLLSAELEGLK